MAIRRARSGSRGQSGAVHADLPPTVRLLSRFRSLTVERDKDREWEQYRLLVEEYRFQVNLNWKRSQYFFVLNIAVFVAGVSLLSASSAATGLIATIFLLGAMLAVLSIFANQTQHGYYREARDGVNRAQQLLNLGDLAIATTPGLGSGVNRLGAVRTFLTVMLVALAIVDTAGALVALGCL